MKKIHKIAIALMCLVYIPLFLYISTFLGAFPNSGYKVEQLLIVGFMGFMVFLVAIITDIKKCKAVK